jgi:hypothetical protein
MKINIVYYFLLVWFILSCTKNKLDNDESNLIHSNIIKYASNLKKEFRIDTINIIAESNKYEDSTVVVYSMVQEVSLENKKFIYDCEEINGIIINYISYQKKINIKNNCLKFIDTTNAIRDYYPEKIWIIDNKIVKKDVPDWTLIKWLQIPPPPMPVH